MIRIPLRMADGSVRAFALIDDEDAELARFRWGYRHAHGHPDRGYAARMVDRRRWVQLHRVIAGLAADDRREVDHKDGNRLDCRRANLRVVPPGGNQQNARAHSDSSSRFRGVSWAAREGKWAARVETGGRCVLFAYFDDEVQAAIAADRKRLEVMPFALPDRELAKALEEAA